MSPHMNVFRRSRSMDIDVAASGRFASRRHGPEPSPDTGPILVAVDGERRSWDALEWAAAEAAARECTLRIVHAVHVPAPLAVDPFQAVSPNGWEWVPAQEAAELVVDEAARRARAVAPELTVTTHVRLGSTTESVLRERRKDVLIVMGRGQTSRRSASFSRSATWKVVRRAACPVAVVEPMQGEARSAPGGRVVVGVDGRRDSTAAFAFAFRAARRRGTALTAIAESFEGRGAGDALRMCRRAFPEVEIRQRLGGAPVETALLAESGTAALVVLGTSPRRHQYGQSFHPAGHDVTRFARSPVVIVKTQS